MGVQVKHELNGKTYLINKWGPTETYLNMPKIAEYFAVPLTMIIGSLGDTSKLSEAIPTALIYLCQHSQQESLDTIFKFILKDVYVIPGDIKVSDNFDTVFQDSPVDVIKLVAKVLEEHYGCFFKKGGLADLLQILAPIVQQKTELYTQE